MAVSLSEIPLEDRSTDVLTAELAPTTTDIRNMSSALVSVRAGSVYISDEMMAKALWRAGYGQYINKDARHLEIILRPSEASFAVEYDGFQLQCSIDSPIQIKDWHSVLTDYIIYKHLRLQYGLYPRNGVKFGCDYTVYRVQTPEQAHSDFLLQIANGTSTNVASLCELAHRCRKSMMLASLIDGQPVIQVLDVYLV